MPDHFINGHWLAGTGDHLTSTNPATQDTLWSGREGTAHEVDAAVNAANEAARSWSEMKVEERATLLTAFAEALSKEKNAFAETISRETGKPLWEALSEVQAMIGKIPLSIEAQAERCPEKRKPAGNALSITRHHPHGVLAVFGPYNFPGHLPNGHIIPALLAGNSIVYKPSEQTPLTGQHYCRIWQENCPLPPGVLNLVQGGRKTGIALAEHPRINGLLFTGSWPTGRALSEQLCAQTEKILALEMGGNNPLIVDECTDLEAAAYLVVQSAFLTSGQRCTCARRLILPPWKSREQFLDILKEMVLSLKTGFYTDIPEPFMGTMINAAAAQKVLSAELALKNAGGIPLIPLKLDDRSPALLKPGIIDVTAVRELPDEEIFGPLLQMILVPDFNTAVQEAGRTRFGLAAGLISDNEQKYRQFAGQVRAGVINWNMPTTGASSAAPFGGVGHSGNYRPSAYYAADYCSYPVASMETNVPELPQTTVPGIFLRGRHGK